MTALDTEARAAFVALLKRHLAAGRLAVIATHEPLAIEARVLQLGGRGMSAFLALLRRDLVLSYRQGIDAWVVVLFFLAAGILFPFAIGPEPNALTRVSTGVVLSMAALAALAVAGPAVSGRFRGWQPGPDGAWRRCRWSWRRWPRRWRIGCRRDCRCWSRRRCWR